MLLTMGNRYLTEKSGTPAHVSLFRGCDYNNARLKGSAI